MPHFILTCITCIIGMFALLKLFIVTVKRDLRFEKYLYGCLFLLYSFSYYDLVVMLLSQYDSFFPGIHLALEGLIQIIYFAFCILFAGIGMIICLFAMIWMLKMVRAPKDIRPWQFTSICLLLLILYIVILQSASLYDIDGYTVVISENWIWGSILLIASFALMFYSNNFTFFPFLKKQANELRINSRKNLFYGILVNLVLGIYAAGLAGRIFLGTTWGNILAADCLCLLSTIIALSLGFFSGFGESLLCVRNMESIYIVHQSGKLIYSRKFFPKSSFDDEFFGAFLIIINEIPKEIRSTGGRISQIILEDDSEIIMSKGGIYSGSLNYKNL